MTDHPYTPHPWDAIHGEGAWDRNDWVTVYDLQRVQ